MKEILRRQLVCNSRATAEEKDRPQIYFNARTLRRAKEAWDKEVRILRTHAIRMKRGIPLSRNALWLRPNEERVRRKVAWPIRPFEI